MLVSLSDTGFICDVKVIKSLEPAIDKQAVNTIRQQLFQPIRQGDKPIPGSMMIFRDFWRGDTSDFLIGENAGAAPDEIPASAQAASPPDIVSLLTAGKIDGSTYTNGYFGLEFTAPGASLTAVSLTDPRGTAVRLVDAVSDGHDRAATYTISLIADRLSNYPQLKSPSDYVHQISSRFLAEGVTTSRDVFPYIISDIQFTGMILKEPEASRPGPYHFRGIFSSPLKGFMLSLNITAGTEKQVLRLASSIQFKNHRR